MGNFDAGSIEARLTLDRSQFKRELEAARAEARNLEANGIDVKLDLDAAATEARIKEIEAELRGLEAPTLDLDLDDAAAKAKIATLKAELATLHNPHVNVDVDTGGATAKVAQVKAELDSIPDKKTTEVDVRTGNGVGRTQAIIAAILAGLPLIPAVVAPATAAILALSASLAAAAGGAAIFALGILAAYKNIAAFNGHVTQMPPAMRAFAAAQKGLSDAFSAFGKAVQTPAFAVMAQGFNLLASILPRLVPVFNAFATVASGALTQLSNWVNGPAGSGVLKWFQTFGAQQFGTLLAILGNVAQAVINILQAFSPFATTLTSGLQQVTAAWVGWTATLSQSEGFKSFMAYVNQVGPMVVAALLSLGRAIIAIGVAVAPLAPPLLSLITMLGNFISSLNPAVLRAIIVAIAALTAGFAAYEAVMSLAGAATVLWSGIMGAVRVATLAWTAAQWLLNAALTANPIGIVVVAIAALVAAIIFAYTHFEWFHNAVDAAWNGIRTVVGAVVSWFTGTAIPAVVSAIVTVVGWWRTMQAVAAAVFGAISNAVRTAWAVVVGVTISANNAVRSAVIAGWNAIRAIVVAVGAAIAAAVVASWHAISTAVTVAINVVRSIVTSGWNAVRSIVIAVSSAILSATVSAWNAIRNAVTSAINTVRSAISSGLSAARSVAVSAFQGILSAARSALGALGGVAASAAGAVRGVFAGAGGWLIAAGRNIIGGLISGIRSMIGSIGSALGGIGSFIASHKGPPSYDKVMLRPHGRWIMGGLINSILSQVPRLGNAMSQVTDTIASTRPGSLATSAGMGLSARVGGGSGVSVLMNVYNPIAEPTSITATKGIKDLAVLGVFS